MASVTLVGVRKIYQEGPGARLAVDGVDLAVSDGEFVVLVGPSGCGKSTTLRMIAGLESISAGPARARAGGADAPRPKAPHNATGCPTYTRDPRQTEVR